MSDSTPEIKYFFIRRPVMAAVLSITVTLLGLFALQRLPVNRYPLITPPAVSVTAVYPGATAEDVAQAVAAPIEQQLSGLDGLLVLQVVPTLRTAHSTCRSTSTSIATRTSPRWTCRTR